MRYKIIFFVITWLIGSTLSGQNGIDPLKVNQFDKQGRKQGYWMRKYANGNVAYEIYFKDNKPVGEYKRYYENGKPYAILNYDDQGIHAKAKMFDEEGNLIATGFYHEKQRDSTWHFYKKGDILIARERYVNNKKWGMATTYYDDGTVAETHNWRDDVENGIWKKYYPSGKQMMEARIVKGAFDGYYLSYTENGTLDVKGNYKNGLKHGKWEYRHWTKIDKQGKPRLTELNIEYENGIAKNEEKLEQLRQMEFEMMEKNKGSFKDPENYRNNPHEYFMKQ